MRRWRPRSMLPASLCVLAVLAACGPPSPTVNGDGGTASGPAGSPSSSSAPTSPPASPASPATPSAPSSSAKATGCRALAESLSLKEQVGQLFMVGIGSEGLGSSEAEILDDGLIGSVILLGNTQIGRTAVRGVTEDVRDAVGTPEDVQVMLTADQEGGEVQRLRGEGFDRMPSAERQAELSDAELTDDAEVWGSELKKAGIDANLAPVADVVPPEMEGVNEPISRLSRGYGSKPKAVAGKVKAFTKGMDRAGLATSVKHFPGLGRVTGNTDFASEVVDSSTTRDDPDLRGFAAGVAAGADMVMVSSATYTKIDPDNAGPYSRIIIEEMIRKDLSFTGVVISDDLAGQAVADLPPGKRAVAFFRAGGDLAIMGDPSQASAMVRAVRKRATTDDSFAADVTTKVTRVLEMKDRRGLADCG